MKTYTYLLLPDLEFCAS